MPDALTEARQKLQEQQALLEQLTIPLWEIGEVVQVLPKSNTLWAGNPLNKITDTVVVATDKGLREVSVTTAAGNKLQLKVGQFVRFNIETGSMISPSPYVRYGMTGVVSKMDVYPNDPSMDIFEVETEQGKVAVPGSLYKPVALGDHVVLNSSATMIMRKFKTESRHAFKDDANINVSWDMIAGLEDAKREMREALELPFQYPELFKAFNRKPVKGFLLHGHPGNGKTMIGKATATAISKLHGRELLGSSFIYVKGPELLIKWVGDTETAIRGLFAHAREHHKKHGYPAVIFLDEAESILIERGKHTASGMQHTVVPQFLSEMDGLEESGAIVMLATNRADILDPAVIRPGRVDRKIYVGPPNKETAKDYFKVHMKDVPISDSTERALLVSQAASTLFSREFPLYRLHTNQGEHTFCLSDLASGAMIAGLVEQAVALAIRRNIDMGRTKTVDGLRWDDFNNAFHSVYQQQGGISHNYNLQMFAEERKIEIVSIKKLIYGGSDESSSKEASRSQQAGK
jgi:proteasome ATPase